MDPRLQMVRQRLSQTLQRPAHATYGLTWFPLRRPSTVLSHPAVRTTGLSVVSFIVPRWSDETSQHRRKSERASGDLDQPPAPSGIGSAGYPWREPPATTSAALSPATAMQRVGDDQSEWQQTWRRCGGRKRGQPSETAINVATCGSSIESALSTCSSSADLPPHRRTVCDVRRLVPSSPVQVCVPSPTR